MLEIELSESLRRKRDQIKAKLEADAVSDSSGGNTDGDVEQRKLELGALVKSIERQARRIEGRPE